MAEDRQRPGESDRAYLHRLNEAHRRQAAEGRQAERNEAEQQRRSDEKWEDDLVRDVFGGDINLGNVRAAYDEDPELFKKADVEREAKWLANQAKSKRGQRKAAKWLQRHPSKAKKIRKATKKSQGGWCSVLAVLMLGVLGGAGYGLFEAGHVIIGALGR